MAEVRPSAVDAVAMACDVLPSLAALGAIAVRLSGGGRVEGGLWSLLVVSVALPVVRRAMAAALPFDPAARATTLAIAMVALGAACVSLTVHRLPGAAAAIVLAAAIAAPVFSALLRAPRGSPLGRVDLLGL